MLSVYGLRFTAYFFPYLVTGTVPALPKNKRVTPVACQRPVAER